MDKNCVNKCNSCNLSSCKELKADKTHKNKKVYCSGKMDHSSCPMYVIPINCEDFQIFNILCGRVKIRGKRLYIKIKSLSSQSMCCYGENIFW